MESSKPARWNTVDESIAYSCSGFDVINQQVELSDGTRTEFDYIDEPDAVVILPFTVDDTVVIIKEWRQAVERYNYGLPAGSIEADESLEEGAQRELQEETGYEANSISHLVSIEPSNGLLNTVHHHFVAYDCEQIGDQRLDNDESIAVDTTNLATLQDKILTNEINDGRTILNVLYYQFAQTQYEYFDASTHGNS